MEKYFINGIEVSKKTYIHYLKMETRQNLHRLALRKSGVIQETDEEFKNIIRQVKFDLLEVQK